MNKGAAWRLELLATPRLLPLHVGGPALPVSLARKDAAWLAYVAQQPQASSAALAAMLWPEGDGRGALNNLRQRVHRLRRATGARLVEMGETIEPAADLQHDQAPPGLDSEDDRAGDGTTAELLGAFTYDDTPEFAAWLGAARRAARHARREALAAAAESAEREGALARALALAHRVLAQDPLSEHAHRRLMRLHHLRGDRAAAIAVFERCETLLKAELGLRPGDETLTLLVTVERARSQGVVAVRQPVPAALSRPPRLVGRDAAWAALADDASPLTLLVGEAGLGKSRLLQEAFAQRVDVLTVQARPGDAAVPYALLVRLLRALPASAACESPALAWLSGEVAPSGTSPALLLAALGAHLAAVQGLACVVADDLHFADRASLELLLRLTQSDELATLRWVLAQRPLDGIDPEVAEPLRAFSGLPQLRVVVLQPLNVQQLHELLHTLDLPGLQADTLAPALLRHTGGNPLFVLETLRAAWLQPGTDGSAVTLPRPHSLAHVIDERLARLSRPALALARVAAVAVPDFEIALAEQVLGAPALALADAWQELEAAQVLRGAGFAHDLVHDAVLRATPAVLAAHTHGQVAAWLAERGAEPARVAEHWRQADRQAEAGAAYLSAAQRVRAAGRAREQAQLLQAAATALDAAGDESAAFDARSQAVHALLHGDGAVAALGLSQQLVRADDETPERIPASLRASAWSAHAQACVWAGRVAEGEAAGRRALALAAAEDQATRVAAACMVGAACGLQGRPEEGLALVLPWAEHVATLPDLARRIELAGALENLMVQADRPAESLAWTHRHLAWAQELGDVGEQVTARMNLGGALLRRGELEAAVEHARAASALAPATGQSDALLAWNETGLAFMLCGLGRYAQGLAIFERELARTAGAPGALRALQEQWLAQVWLTLGQPARAMQLLGDDASLPSGMPRGKRLLARAQLVRATGGDERALLQEALAAASAPVARFEWLQIRVLQAAHEEPQQALVSAQDIGALAAAREYHTLSAAAEAQCLRALHSLGRSAQAGASAARLEALALGWRHPSNYLPEQMLAAAAGYRAAGCEADAVRCESQAMHWLHAVALPQVPAEFVHGFLHRNPVNARLGALRGLQARQIG